MLREEAPSWIVPMIIAAVAIVGCGGTTTGIGTHVDVGDAAAGGARNGAGGAGTSSGGSSGSRLVACNDGTGNTDCCPPSAVSGAPCSPSDSSCSTPCSGGFQGHRSCSGGIWLAGRGLTPCGADAGVDGGVSQMSCNDLHAAWTSFWESHAQCMTDADCTTFLAIDPSSSPCDAPPGLNQAINKQFMGDAQPYADRYFRFACGGDRYTRPNARNGLWSDFGYDGAALTNPRCVSGLCSADSLQCNTPPPFDGGSGDASRTSCPGAAGPSMVRVPAPNGTTYCIDSTEVTNSQYMEFLHSKGSGPSGGSDTSGQDPRCSWNTAYEPQDSICVAQYDPYARPDYPMVCIDWCDASAYCKWAGKHLCGKIGGGPNGYADFSTATKSEWFNACSKGGALTYPYGNTLDANACNGAPLSLFHTVVVGSMAKCEGGHPGLFDLSGNVWEWEDSCEGASGSGDACRIRGGSVNDFNQGLSCGSDYADPRSVASGGLGFRCCGE